MSQHRPYSHFFGTDMHKMSQVNSLICSPRIEEHRGAFYNI